MGILMKKICGLKLKKFENEINVEFISFIYLLYLQIIIEYLL